MLTDPLDLANMVTTPSWRNTKHVGDTDDY